MVWKVVLGMLAVMVHPSLFWQLSKKSRIVDETRMVTAALALRELGSVSVGS